MKNKAIRTIIIVAVIAIAGFMAYQQNLDVRSRLGVDLSRPPPDWLGAGLP